MGMNGVKLNQHWTKLMERVAQTRSEKECCFPQCQPRNTFFISELNSHRSTSNYSSCFLISSYGAPPSSLHVSFPHIRPPALSFYCAGTALGIVLFCCTCSDNVSFDRSTIMPTLANVPTMFLLTGLQSCQHLLISMKTAYSDLTSQLVLTLPLV